MNANANDDAAREPSVEEALARIAARNHCVRAVLRTMPDEARVRTLELDALEPARRGPLHRVPYVLKDVWDVAGVPTTSGSWRYRDRVPRESCRIQEALQHAGAVLVGKSNLSDLAVTPESDNTMFGPVCNPHDLERTSGGSTGGGAAAVADGMCAFDWGTDYGGSIRLPAAFCGVVGLKLSRATWPIGQAHRTIDDLGLNGVGPIAATVAGCRRVVDAVRARVRGPDVPAPFVVRGLSRLDLDAFSTGQWPAWVDDARRAAAAVELDVSRADFPPPREVDRAFASFLGSRIERVFAGQVGATAFAALKRLLFGDLLDTPAMHRHTARVLAKLAVARCTVYRSRRAADARVAVVRAAARAAFDDGRLLLTPTTTFPAPRHGGAVFPRGGIAAFVKLGNVIDATAIAVPFGRFACGLPRSIQLLGPAGSEEAVLDVAERLEAAA